MLTPEQLAALLTLTDYNIVALYSIIERETMEEMAVRLGIAFDAAKSRRRALYRRLGVEGQREVLLWAVEQGIVTADEIVERILENGCPG